MAETTGQQHSAHGHSSQQDAILTVSDVERLQAIGFEAMSAAQIARARAEILRARRLFGLRRTCPAARGASSDDTLTQSNRRWAKRILSQGATVLLVMDDLNRAEADGLAPAMERLHRLCRRLIWFDPLLRRDRFEPKSQGIRVMPPHVDEFRPVHTIASLRALVVALFRPMPARGRPLEIAA